MTYEDITDYMPDENITNYFTSLKGRFDRFGTYDSTTKTFTEGLPVTFHEDCQKAKVNVDEILADLIITDTAAADRTDAEEEKNARIESVLIRNYTPLPSRGAAFNPAASRAEKLEWVKKHLDLGEKIAVLAEVQAIENIVTGANPYPSDVFKARKQKSDAQKECITNAETYKADYKAFLNSVKEAIAAVETKIKDLTNAKTTILATKSYKNANNQSITYNHEEVEKANERIQKYTEQLNALIALYNEGILREKAFIAAMDKALRDGKIFEKDETKKEDKSEDKGSTSSVKSPYSSLSDRGKQASDSEQAKDLYQSFAAADAKSKFLMLTGLDAHNMLEIARNLAKVGDRKDLQEYCQKCLDSNYIKYDGTTLAGFTITTADGKTITLPALTKAKLIEGLLDYDAENIRKEFELLSQTKLTNLSVEDLEKIENYSNALLISSTLSESRWGKGKQITKGWLHLPGRKKNDHYDLANDVATFMKPIHARKDKIFKDINKEVNKGIDSNDHIVYGRNTAVSSGKGKYELRTDFDDR